jgi:hypothetical protein
MLVSARLCAGDPLAIKRQTAACDERHQARYIAEEIPMPVAKGKNQHCKHPVMSSLIP